MNQIKSETGSSVKIPMVMMEILSVKGYFTIQVCDSETLITVIIFGIACYGVYVDVDVYYGSVSRK